MKRFWEIDSLRGIAILMMIAYHYICDIGYFKYSILKPDSGSLWLFGRSIPFIFIFLVGVCLTISYSRAKNKLNKKQLKLKYLKRGLKIFSWGLLISLMTWLFLKEGFVRFGILHFIGISIIFAYPFLRFKYLNLLFAFSSFAIGLYLTTQSAFLSWLLWLGLRPVGFYTVDYFPIFPWFGIILLGLFFGKFLYPNAKRKFNLPDLRIPVLPFLGRNSLLIYLIHQPILIAFLHLFIL